MVLVDANVILRYLLNDIPGQAQVAREAIDSGAMTEMEVIAEVVYVLQGVYEVPRATIAGTLSALCDRLDCPRQDVLLRALGWYGTTNLDFVDCVLLATESLGKATVLTFDKKLDKAIRRERDAMR